MSTDTWRLPKLGDKFEVTELGHSLYGLQFEIEEIDWWSRYPIRILDEEFRIDQIKCIHARDDEPAANHIADPNKKVEPAFDPVNKPKHYNSHPSGVECITITEHETFCVGNAIKYLWRADQKDRRIEDLEKAAWYVNREIQRLKAIEETHA